MRRIGTAALVIALASLGLAQDARKSGFEFMQPATQALQKDDTQNPAMLWVKDGQALWSSPDGTAKKSCADCHGEINRMRGVATRYPQYSGDAKRVINLSQQINQCRMTRQQAKVWPSESSSLLGLEVAVAIESRGQPVSVVQPARSVKRHADVQLGGRQRFQPSRASCADRGLICDESVLLRW